MVSLHIDIYLHDIDKLETSARSPYHRVWLKQGKNHHSFKNCLLTMHPKPKGTVALRVAHLTWTCGADGSTPDLDLCQLWVRTSAKTVLTEFTHKISLHLISLTWTTYELPHLSIDLRPFFLLKRILGLTI